MSLLERSAISIPCWSQAITLATSSCVKLSIAFFFKFLGIAPDFANSFFKALKSFIITTLSVDKSFIPLAYGFNKCSLNQAIWASPTFPLPKNLYNNPVKSSADGGIKNLNLPLPAPIVCALAAEYSLYQSIPVFCSNILLKSSSTFLLNLVWALCTLDFLSTTLNTFLSGVDWLSNDDASCKSLPILK